ncbi:hypothetical protein HID58_010878 [Brassica napus]|uniref:Uncharacterized protein n=1 Tax=Brassica napus TaxID=3708 RepID=A0ABQ8DEL2_BRANA|nr:hypothetical protein HID58_020064 [Brassica napus]KAH0933761.1 hypothetical protein HID58_010878 [Brassica napus]
MAPREGTTRPKKLFPERVRLRREVRPVSVLNLSSPDKPSRSRLMVMIEPFPGRRRYRASSRGKWRGRCVCGTRVEIRAHSQSRC